MVTPERGDLRLPTALARATNTPCCEHSTQVRGRCPRPKRSRFLAERPPRLRRRLKRRNISTLSGCSQAAPKPNTKPQPLRDTAPTTKRLPRGNSTLSVLRSCRRAPTSNNFLATPQLPVSSSRAPKPSNFLAETSTRSASSNNFLAGHAQLPVKLSTGPKTQLPRGPHPHSAS